MPDKDGRFLPTFYSLSAERWSQLFGKSDPDPEFTIEWTPEWDLDGATFIPECECKDRCADPKRDDCRNPKS